MKKVKKAGLEREDTCDKPTEGSYPDYIQISKKKSTEQKNEQETKISTSQKVNI